MFDFKKKIIQLKKKFKLKLKLFKSTKFSLNQKSWFCLKEEFIFIVVKRILVSDYFKLTNILFLCVCVLINN